MSFLLQVKDMLRHIAGHILRKEEYLEARDLSQVPLPLPHSMPDNPCGFCGGGNTAGMTFPKPRFQYLKSRDANSASLNAYFDAGRCWKLLVPHG